MTDGDGTGPVEGDRDDDIGADASGSSDDATESHEDTAATPADREATPPEEVLGAGLSPMLSLARQGAAAVGLPEPKVLADDVLTRPPDERFRESATDYADRFGLPLLDPDALSSLGGDVPVDDPMETAVRTVVRNAGRWQGKLLAQLLAEPADPEPYLGLAMLLERLEHAALDARQARETGEGDLTHLLSTGLALLARLVTLVEDESAVVGDEVYRDVVAASYHLEVAVGSDPAFDPAARTDAECRRIVRLQGAMLAFDTFDRPADEVAALTGVQPDALLAAIGRRDEL